MSTTEETRMRELFGAEQAPAAQGASALAPGAAAAAAPAPGEAAEAAEATAAAAAPASAPVSEKRRARASRGLTRRAPASEPLRVGAYPVARLLPPEILAQGKVRTTRMLVIYLIIAVIVLAGLATGGAYLHAQQAQSELTAIQAQNSSVLVQENKYAPARDAAKKVALAEAAQRVGAASEIDWSSYLAKIQAVLPQGVSVTAFSGETGTATTSVAQDSAPLSSSRAAVVTLTVNAPDQDSIANTLDQLTKLPGYVGAFPGAMTQGGGASSPGSSGSGSGSSGSGSSGSGTSAAATGSWTVPITLSLNSGAFSNRFADNNK